MVVYAMDETQDRKEGGVRWRQVCMVGRGGEEGHAETVALILIWQASLIPIKVKDVGMIIVIPTKDRKSIPKDESKVKCLGSGRTES